MWLRKKGDRDPAIPCTENGKFLVPTKKKKMNKKTKNEK